VQWKTSFTQGHEKNFPLFHTFPSDLDKIHYFICSQKKYCLIIEFCRHRLSQGHILLKEVRQFLSVIATRIVQFTLNALYTLSYTARFYCVTSYLTEKLNKLFSFDGNSAGLRTVLSSRLSHRKLRSSLRESYSFHSLPADTTMASSQKDTHTTDQKNWQTWW
jgi:hypothetical protein